RWMERKRKYTPKQVIKAIKGSAGIKASIVERLHCSRPTLDKYIRDFPEVLAAFTEETERVLDMAEGNLFTLVKNGDLSAIFYLLNNKGRSRGYGARPEDEKKRLKPIALSMILAYVPTEDAGEAPAEAPAEEASNGGN
ncbi:MAG: hypothetical protein K6E40_05680, partial [Desulfovibrio sp.]|nr:hypothetical protein [Desulfovibrio sp.]